MGLMDMLIRFLEKYGISLDNLSEFESDDIDEYDDDHLSDVLVEYVRAHISEFAEE